MYTVVSVFILGLSFTIYLWIFLAIRDIRESMCRQVDQQDEMLLVLNDLRAIAVRQAMGSPAYDEDSGVR